ncbi:hypothetical protein I7I51_08874 [Histoplasma capsulatum]|uniref:Uncharacterized protein n=1 Tax=Ajellomyces capsulatus TaxID=5037 RepID=A0A8A1M013_AJECA|nr:hypothetical protein I7I51_08874 [Histoplasma capsulatum]
MKITPYNAGQGPIWHITSCLHAHNQTTNYNIGSRGTVFVAGFIHESTSDFAYLIPVSLFATGSPWVVPLSCLAEPDKRNAEFIPNTVSTLDAIFSDSGYESDFIGENEDAALGRHCQYVIIDSVQYKIRFQTQRRLFIFSMHSSAADTARVFNVRPLGQKSSITTSAMLVVEDQFVVVGRFLFTWRNYGPDCLLF